MKRHFVVAALVVAACCAPTDPPPPDAGDPCTPASHPATLCQDSLSFADGPPLPVATDHHGTVVASAGDATFLYVIGGNNYRTVLQTAFVSPLGPDGTPGAWARTTPLPSPTAGHGITVVHGSDGDRIIVVSGQDNGTFPTAVRSALVGADGALAAWAAEPDLPEARFHGYVSVWNGFLYVTGGLSPAFSATATVFYAPIRADGTLGPFAQTTSLPAPRSHHYAVAWGGWLYVVGGLTGNPAGMSADLTDLLAAPIGADGQLGAFATIGALDLGDATLSGFILDDQLHLVGGLDENLDYSAQIRRAPLVAGGGLGPLALLPTTLPQGRSHVHQTPLWRDRFYSIGGSIDYQTVTNAVRIGAFQWSAR